MKNRTQKLKTMIVYGIVVIIPVILVLSYLFAKLKMPDALSIFLIVLIGGAVIFVYYLIYTHFENKIEEKNKDKPDPFAD